MDNRGVSEWDLVKPEPSMTPQVVQKHARHRVAIGLAALAGAACTIAVTWIYRQSIRIAVRAKMAQNLRNKDVIRRKFQELVLPRAGEPNPDKPHFEEADGRRRVELMMAYFLKYACDSGYHVYLVNPRPRGPIASFYNRNKTRGLGASYITIPYWPSDMNLFDDTFTPPSWSALLWGVYPPLRSVVYIGDQDWYMDVPSLMAENNTCSFVFYSSGIRYLDATESIVDSVVKKDNGSRSYTHQYWDHLKGDVDYLTVSSTFGPTAMFRRTILAIPGASDRILVLYTPHSTWGFWIKWCLPETPPLERAVFNRMDTGDGVWYYRMYFDHDLNEACVFHTREGSNHHTTFILRDVYAVADHLRKATVKPRPALVGSTMRTFNMDPTAAPAIMDLIKSLPNVSDAVGTAPFIRMPNGDDYVDGETPLLLESSPALVGVEAAHPGAPRTEGLIQEGVVHRVLTGQLRGLDQEQREVNERHATMSAPAPTTNRLATVVEEMAEELSADETPADAPIRPPMRVARVAAADARPYPTPASAVLAATQELTNRLKPVGDPILPTHPLNLEEVELALTNQAQVQKFNNFMESGVEGLDQRMKDILLAKMRRKSDWVAAGMGVGPLEPELPDTPNFSPGFMKPEAATNSARFIVAFPTFSGTRLIQELEAALKPTQFWKDVCAFTDPVTLSERMAVLMNGRGPKGMRSYDFSKFNSSWRDNLWSAVYVVVGAILGFEVTGHYLDETAQNGVAVFRVKKPDGTQKFVLVPYFSAHQDGARDTSIFNCIANIIFLLSLFMYFEQDASRAWIRLSEGTLVGGDDSTTADVLGTGFPGMEMVNEIGGYFNLKITEEVSDPERQYCILLGRYWTPGENGQARSRIDEARQLRKMLCKKPSKPWGAHWRDKLLGLHATDRMDWLNVLADAVHGKQQSLRWVQKICDDESRLVYPPLTEEEGEDMRLVQGLHIYEEHLEDWKKFTAKVTQSKKDVPFPPLPLAYLPPQEYKVGGTVLVDDMAYDMDQGRTLDDVLPTLEIHTEWKKKWSLSFTQKYKRWLRNHPNQPISREEWEKRHTAISCVLGAARTKTSL